MILVKLPGLEGIRGRANGADICDNVRGEHTETVHWNKYCDGRGIGVLRGPAIVESGCEAER